MTCFEGTKRVVCITPVELPSSERFSGCKIMCQYRWDAHWLTNRVGGKLTRKRPSGLRNLCSNPGRKNKFIFQSAYTGCGLPSLLCSLFPPVAHLNILHHLVLSFRMTGATYKLALHNVHENNLSFASRTGNGWAPEPVLMRRDEHVFPLQR